MWGRRVLGSSPAALVLLTLLASGCGTPIRRSPVAMGAGSGGPDSTGSAAAASLPGGPDWATMPHSWRKLEAIETWLGAAAKGGAHTVNGAFWQTEGRLQLAEGQLKFATAGRAPGTPEHTLAFRRESARDGFEEVLGTPAAKVGQRQRAQSGLRQLDGTDVPILAASAVPVDGLIRRSAWSAARANRREMTPATTRWRWITVHHSDFTQGGTGVADTLETVRRIQRFHVESNGWADIGYHYLIDSVGRVVEGRELVWQGAHVGGSNNRGNVGICLIGNFDKERPTRAALASLDRLVYELQSELQIPRKNVRPHKAWTATACPGKHLMPWFAQR